MVAAVADLLRRTLEAGATRVSLQVNVVRGCGRTDGAGDGGSDGGRGHPFVAAVKPLVDAMGARWCAPDQARGDDVVLSWEGEDVVAVRLPHLADSLDHLLADLERRHGRPLPELDRKDKQTSYASWRSAARSRCGTAWRPSPRHSASAASPSTTT